eukprot:TRINITY_DN2765_c0_g1_i2.p1 TRINITY_DN2765_c0_g1~~TRINITY_DN2765_c0_g1_i2.p1  ORF type:complete len:377 (+),score=72.13 TRINITY_DN2765_c0_g1_i2:705-1835(+)
MENHQQQYYNTSSVASLQQRPQKQQQEQTYPSSSQSSFAPQLPQNQQGLFGAPPSQIPQSFSFNSSNLQQQIPQFSSYSNQIPQQQYNQIPQQQSLQSFQSYQAPSDSGNITEVLGGYTELELRGVKGYGNETSDEFDLGKDNAFSDFSVAIISFYDASSTITSTAGPALQKKGFKVNSFCSTQTKEFIQALNSGNYDVAWIISDDRTHISPEFQESVKKFHQSKRGLMIWADNRPYFYQANILLKDLVGATLIGYTSGDRILSYGNPLTPGEFTSDHLIFAGVNYLHEGVTICYPEPLGKLNVLATSSNGKPCIACTERSENGGRIVVDTGFTKLFPAYWSKAGQARYIVNATVWLVDIEGRYDAKNEGSSTKAN